jgi:hypothetical protein
MPRKDIYDEWAKVTETRPLYIHGSSYDAVENLSNLLSFMWRKKITEKKVLDGTVLVFTFDSSDPLRSSISGMLASFILEVTQICLEETEEGHDSRDILHDWHLFR